MRRRHFIAVCAGAVAFPRLAGSTQKKAMPIIGVLLYGTKQLDQEHPLLAGLRDAGLIDGKTATILLREAEGRPERLPALAAELVAMTPDIIVTAGPQPIRAVKEATSTIPIVMAIVSDPVTYGFVASLSHPRRQSYRDVDGQHGTQQQAHRFAARSRTRHFARRRIHRSDDRDRKVWTKPQLLHARSESTSKFYPSPRPRSCAVLPRPRAAKRRRCS